MIARVRRSAGLLTRPLRRVVDREIDDRLLRRADLISTAHTEPQDIFIVGYPKSGNTWMQNLVAGLMFGMDMRFVPDTLVQNLVPDLHYQPYYRRYLPFAVFKSHSLPRAEYRRVIYLVRDGRDAMVSYFHYLSATNSALDFRDLVTRGKGLFPCAWCEHVEKWIRNPCGAEMIIVRYEDLMRDTAAQLCRICAFAGLEREPATVDMVAQTCTFEVMRRKEKEYGWDDRGAWPKDKPFVRRGQVQSYKDEMPAAVLDAFMDRSRAALEMVGYPSA